MAAMSWWRPWGAMFKKNALVMRRHPVAVGLDILAAPAVLALLVAVWSSFSPVVTPTSDFGSDAITVAPLTILGYRLGLRGQQLAVVGPASRTAPLMDFLATSYPPFDGSCCFDRVAFPSLATTQLAGLSTVLARFPSDEALNAYISSSTYGFGGGSGGLVWAAVVVNEWGLGRVDVDIRMNGKSPLEERKGLGTRRAHSACLRVLPCSVRVPGHDRRACQHALRRRRRVGRRRLRGLGAVLW